VLKQWKSFNTSKLKEFIKQVLFMDLVKSPGLVELLGICYFSQDGQQSLLMVIELASCGDLTNCHPKIPKNSEKLKVKIAYDLARALCDLHSAQGLSMIHRDVRAQNVFIFSLDENTIFEQNVFHAKLGDFGAIVASPNYGENLGNWQYMAPEAFSGALHVPYSAKIDVYSFGIVLWEIFAGQPPFADLLRNENAMTKICNGERPKLEKHFSEANYIVNH
jgi:serine/threonine protein kinase